MGVTLRRLSRVVVIVLLQIGLTIFLSGASGSWNGSVDGDWNNTANWTPGPPPSGAAEDAVIATGALNYPNVNTPADLQNLTIENGASLTLDQPLQVHGLLQIDAGGTLNLAGNNLTVLNLIVNGSLVLGGANLTVTGAVQVGTGASLTLTQNTTITSLTVQGTGTLDTGGFNLIVSGNVSGTGTVDASAGGNLTLGGNFNPGTFVPGAGSVTVNGAANQNLTFGAVTLNNLTLNKTGGTANILSNITITNTLNLVSGSLNAATVTLTVGDVSITPPATLTLGTLRATTNTNLSLGANNGGLWLNNTELGQISGTGVTFESQGTGDLYLDSVTLPSTVLGMSNFVSANAIIVSGTSLIPNGAVLNSSPAGITAQGVLRATGQAITFQDPVQLLAAFEVDTTNAGGNANGAAIQFQGNVLGAQNLTLISRLGNVTFTGDVTVANFNLHDNHPNSQGSIIVQGALSATSVITQPRAYSISFLGDVTVTNPATFQNTGNLTLGDALTDALTFNGGITAEAPQNLYIDGTFQAPVPSFIFASPITLTANRTIKTSNAPLLFQNTATVNANIAGSHTFTVSSSATKTFESLIGGTTPMYALLVQGSGNALIRANIRAEGNTITFNSPVLVDTVDVTIHEVLGDIIFNSTVTVNAGLTLTLRADDNVLFNGGAGSVLGAGNLILRPHNLTMAVSNGDTVFALTGNLTLNNADTETLTFSNGLNFGSTVSARGIIQTSNNPLVLSGATILTGNTTFHSGTGNMTFGGTLDGNAAGRNLTLNSTGVVTFNGLVGNTQALGTLISNAGGSVVINTTGITTTGAQTYNDAVVLGANVTLAAGAGAINLANTVNADLAANNRTLTLNSTGTTTLGGVVGGTEALLSLTTNAGGSTQINGGVVITTGAQTYNDAVTLGANTTLNSGAGNITFQTTLNGNAAGRNLTLNSTGVVTFNGLVGNTQALGDLTSNAGGSVVINTTGITTTGAKPTTMRWYSVPT
jgi:hypothetical protein